MTTRPRRSGEPRRLLIALALTGLAASLAASPASAATRVAGCPIDKNDNAWSGWIGVRETGTGMRVFNYQPFADNVATSYGAIRTTNDFRGAQAGPSARATHRAAWLLSEYGGIRDDVTAAAVDASVYHLLQGDEWMIGGARGADRLARISNATKRDAVRSKAKAILDASRKYAGPYTTVGSATNTAGTFTTAAYSTARVTVTAASGAPLSGLTVSFTGDSNALLTKSVTHTATTDAHGVAATTFTGKRSLVTAVVQRLPQGAISYRKATGHPDASDVVIGGVTTSRSLSLIPQQTS